METHEVGTSARSGLLLDLLPVQSPKANGYHTMLLQIQPP